MRGAPDPRRDGLLRWYRKHRRDLPWRGNRDPYAVWVSEIMLQQTRVETVIPFYRRFLERFPTVRALAGAPEADVLAAWSGLGYYRRARNMRAAARAVMREHGGRVPADPAGLRALPGIGRYTAAAIASIAFGVPAAAVDGNVIRVLARWYGLRGGRDDARLRREVEARADELAPGPSPGEWTQALMELGATRCLPRAPLCERCPVSESCRALRSGRPDRFPRAAKAAAVKRERRVLLLIRRRSLILLLPDPADGGVTLSPPSAILRGRADSRRVAAALARAHGARPLGTGAARTIRHRTYSHDYSVEVWEATATQPQGARRATPRARWSRLADLAKLPVRALTLKAVEPS